MALPQSDTPGMGIVVPFDFDYSGLINTYYATPVESLGIESVQERLYLGPCRSEDVFLEGLKEFSDRKEEFYKIINEFPYLNNKSKKEMIVYLESFFGDFDKNNTIVIKLGNECSGP